ncbi:MAG: hypothetical protein IPM42_10085 [Saprospiraceae bacterium]|nr:hypothetical protein [Saprospiraceae bacterium]
MVADNLLVNKIFWVIILSGYFLISGCDFEVKDEPIIKIEDFAYKKGTIDAPDLLSEYQMFEEPLASMNPRSGVYPYDLNASLFTDYALKKRFIYLPAGTSMQYDCDDVFNFPEGSLIFKFFFYPEDFRKADGKNKILETRVLKKEKDRWTAFTYIWNDQQTDAGLVLAGQTIPVSWADMNGNNQSVAYSVPNVIQCKNCHEKSGELVPIGPAGKHLNKNYAFTSHEINQIDFFTDKALLTNAENYKTCNTMINYEDPTAGNLNDRARSYLDINCAHCHRPDGSAKNSGLNLLFSEKDPFKYGIFKTPVAAGRGSGGYKYDIHPGNANTSILAFRMNSSEPGIMMPESGRKMIHHEGVALISEWINSLE